MENVLIKQVPVGDFEVFTYIVACAETRQAAIIDPAGEPERITTLIEEARLRVTYILNTHGHPDHILANEQLRVFYDASVCMHEADVDFFSRAEVCESMDKELGLSCRAPVDIRLEDGRILEMGKLRIEVIHTPGHTPGSVCFLVNGNLFTGDTLFVGAAGRTDLPGASLDTLIESIEKKLLVLPGDTVIWPGHDYGETPTSNLAREMKENIYITDFILDV